MNAVTQFDALPPTQGGVVFVGDSLTNEGRWAEMWPELTVRNLGVPGDTTWGLLARQRQVVDARPARIFVMIGTNDLAAWRKSPESVAANVDILLKTWSIELPETQIFIQGVMPREPEYELRIVELNTRLNELAKRYGALYVDTYSPFLVSGRLDPAVTVDGLHLTGKGYARWRKIIQDCVVAVLSCSS